MDIPRLDRGHWIRAAATHLHHSKSNTRSNLHLQPTPQQRWILNPLSEARDPTCIFMDTGQVHNHWATMGTPPKKISWNIVIYKQDWLNDTYNSVKFVLNHLIFNFQRQKKNPGWFWGGRVAWQKAMRIFLISVVLLHLPASVNVHLSLILVTATGWVLWWSGQDLPCKCSRKWEHRFFVWNGGDHTPNPSITSGSLLHIFLLETGSVKAATVWGWQNVTSTECKRIQDKLKFQVISFKWEM